MDDKEADRLSPCAGQTMFVFPRTAEAGSEWCKAEPSIAEPAPEVYQARREVTTESLNTVTDTEPANAAVCTNINT